MGKTQAMLASKGSRALETGVASGDGRWAGVGAASMQLRPLSHRIHCHVTATTVGAAAAAVRVRPFSLRTYCHATAAATALPQ